jgi:hypothetical protein
VACFGGLERDPGIIVARNEGACSVWRAEVRAPPGAADSLKLWNMTMNSR